ncbi:DUF7146 domain-containing protein [Xanthobacter versatilis]|uniref:DUF7146 domain-containing protein n=1 Tax=Xanthobacter autotrophicus (strain ATCC BAA-1158 / Py2) TaxID=78245 RepID=UPI0037291A89
MDLRSIASALGGEVIGRQVLAPGPGHSRKDRSLAVVPSPRAPGGFLVHSHCGDDWKECRDHVCDALGISPPERRRKPTRDETAQRREANARAVEEAAADTAKRTTWALGIWAKSVDPRGRVVETYLESRALPLGEDLARTVLRFHGSLRYGEARHAGMVALMRDILTDEPCGIHRTFLAPDGRKIDRRMLGRAKGAAIKLDPLDGPTLTIGEGIETAMSGRLFGFAPAWALGSADAIAFFPVLPGIARLTILGETDDSGANAKAVKTCARRWMAASREVFVVEPRIPGDLNDVLMEAAT